MSNQLIAQELVVSAGDNLILTLPENEVELKAFVVSALPAGKGLVFLCDTRGQVAGLLFTSLCWLFTAQVHLNNTV